MSEIIQHKNNLPANLISDIISDGESQQEDFDKKDVSIPFLRILQGQSPQCSIGTPSYIEGAKASDYYNTLTKQVYPSRDGKGNNICAFEFIHLYFSTSYIEWTPDRKLASVYTEETARRVKTFKNDKNKDIVAEGSELGTPGNELSYTHNRYICILEEDKFYPIAFPCSSTNIKPSKELNSSLRSSFLPNDLTGGKQVKAPYYFPVWEAHTKHRSNKDGSWFMFDFKPAGNVLKYPYADELVEEAKDFIASIKSNSINVDYTEGLEEETTTNNTSGGRIIDVDSTDDVPF